MKMAKWILIHASCAVLLLLMVAPTASADTITLDISNPNSALSGSTTPPPYATVSVSLINPTQARVEITSNSTAPTSYMIGAAQGVDLNINGTIDGAQFVINTPQVPGFGIPFPSLGNAPQNVSEFGSFDFVIDFQGGFEKAATEMVFTVTLIGGSVPWSSAADVLMPNDKGFEAAIHAFACENPTGTGCVSPFAGGSALTTGFAANGPFTPPKPIPEPAGMTLVGMSLLGAYRALRRKA